MLTIGQTQSNAKRPHISISAPARD